VNEVGLPVGPVEANNSMSYVVARVSVLMDRLTWFIPLDEHSVELLVWHQGGKLNQLALDYRMEFTKSIVFSETLNHPELEIT